MQLNFNDQICAHVCLVNPNPMVAGMSNSDYCRAQHFDQHFRIGWHFSNNINKCILTYSYFVVVKSIMWLSNKWHWYSSQLYEFMRCFGWWMDCLLQVYFGYIDFKVFGHNTNIHRVVIYSWLNWFCFSIKYSWLNSICFGIKYS